MPGKRSIPLSLFAQEPGVRSRQENPECEEEHVEQNSETQYRDPVGKPHPAKASHRPARPVDQRPGAAGGTPGARGEQKSWSQGGNPRSQENEERGDEQSEVLASS